MCSVRASDRSTLSETPGEVSAFHSGVVRGAHSGEFCDFLAAQSLDPALTAEDRHTSLLGSEAGPHPGKELLHVAAKVHAIDRSRRRRLRGKVCECLPAPAAT